MLAPSSTLLQGRRGGKQGRGGAMRTAFAAQTFSLWESWGFVPQLHLPRSALPSRKTIADLCHTPPTRNQSGNILSHSLVAAECRAWNRKTD